MLSKDDFIKIGKIKKKIKINQGEYILYLSTNFDVFSILNDKLFIDINNGDLLPVFPESYSEQTESTIKIKFNEIKPDFNKNIYLNRDVYIHKSIIENINIDVTNFDVIGWNVKDINSNLKGIIYDILSSKQQTTLIVKANSNTSENEIMIPFHENLIVDFDIDNKTITFNLPDGLLNINNN